MKTSRVITLTALILSLLALCVGAQEIPTANGENATGKSDGGPAGLIESSNYAFSAQSGVALDDMSTGTSLLLGSNLDNDSSAPAPIGFLFRFDGVNFTTFGVNANGLARLGGQVTTTSTLNALNSVTNAPKIMPFWDDLCIGIGGKVHYRTTGAFGSRKLVVEWQNMKITRAGACDGTGGGTFQMWMFEGTGIVQFVYGSGMTASANGGYSIGLQSGEATNFASVTTATNSVSYSTANNTQMDAIGSGTSYLFSPAVPASPTGGSVAPVRQASLQLNWTDNAGGEDGYLVWRSTDNFNFALVGQLPADSTSFPDTGLTPSTQYFYRVSSMGNGAFSPMLAFSQITNTPGSISSTAAGGLWSAPSTWAGGLVPDGGDTVTIPSGATVTIDTAAVAGSVKIGNVGSRAETKVASIEGGSPAVLVFGESAAYSLTVAGDVTIGSNDTLATGGGTITDHILSVGGDLTNNGTLDLSTNNNLAGARIVFTGNSSNTFGGGGPVTDIRTITVNKGPTFANILELNPANFTVQGRTSHENDQGLAFDNYLTLNQGTFKISGTFQGTFRTFNVAAYDVSAEAGIWLNNPNYTIAPQNDFARIFGLLRITAGTYGASGTLRIPMQISGTTIIEGGSLSTTGGINGGAVYTQTGGTVTTCTIPATGGTWTTCFSMGGAVTMSGGHIVLQNPAPDNDIYINDYSVKTGTGPAGMGPITGTTVHFGNALTAGTSTFRADGLLPNVAIDTTAGAHHLILAGSQQGTSTRNVSIPPGGTLDFSNYNMMGDTLVNNGTLNAFTPSYIAFDDGTRTLDLNYSGTGLMTGDLWYLIIRAHSITFDPSAGNIRAQFLTVDTAQVVNAARITMVKGTNQPGTISMLNGGSLDSAPDFSGSEAAERVYYGGTGNVVTGPEIRPGRSLRELDVNITGSVTIADGDLALTHFLRMDNGVIKTGSNVLTLVFGVAPFRTNGYVDGHMRREIGSAANYQFDVGQNGYSPVVMEVTSVSAGSYLTVTPVDTTLPGLLPATSLSRYWHLEEEGSLSSRLSFYYTAGDIRGNPNTYKLWFANGGAPAVVPGFLYQAPTGMQSPFGITDYTGDWGVGNDLDPGPVTVSGRVTTSSGNPIRNASVTISGGNLPAPVRIFTGSLGTYFFSGLQAGEIYTVQVSAKRYRFPAGGSQQVTPFGNVADVDFAANPQEEF